METIFINADFAIKTHAKWILTGEHAVLRGHPALVFPLPQRFITWYYWRTTAPLVIELPNNADTNLTDLFWPVFNHALSLLKQKSIIITGKFIIESNIPMGAGLGFSAAFCVGLTRWLIWQQWLAADQLFNFARQLENYFHGQSSGVDIAGSMHDQGVQFCLPNFYQSIEMHWQPQLFLSYSGQAGLTTQCVQKVAQLMAQNKTQGEMIDQQMAQSVYLARHALMQPEAIGLILLQQGLQLGLTCFKNWGLVSSPLQTHIDQLLMKGALAAKPTGAGQGGYVLSLWNKDTLENQTNLNRPAMEDLLSVW